MARTKRNAQPDKRIAPAGPLGHLINDTLSRLNLGYEPAIELVNQAAARDGQPGSAYTRSSVRNWIGRLVVPHRKTLRWISEAWRISPDVLAQAAQATEELQRVQQRRETEPHTPLRNLSPEVLSLAHDSSRATDHHVADTSSVALIETLLSVTEPTATAVGHLPYYVWDMKRRQFIRAGSAAALLAALSSLPPNVNDSYPPPLPGTGNIDAKTLDAYWRLLDQCWTLLNVGQLEAVEHTIQGFLPDVLKQSADRPAVAALAAQSLRLLSLIRTHQLRLHEKVALNQQAVEYARHANDPTLLVAALTELAVAFKYAHQPENSFATYVEAVSRADSAAPLVRSRVYAATGAAFAERSRTSEAAVYISRAHQAFPADPQKEPDWRAADYGIWLLSFYEGVALMASGNHEAAQAAFVGYRHHSTADLVPERNRLELTNYLARTAIAAGDVDEYAHHLTAAINGAGAIRSWKRLDEAVAIYRYETPDTWRQQPQIKQIGEQLASRQPMFGIQPQ